MTVCLPNLLLQTVASCLCSLFDPLVARTCWQHWSLVDTFQWKPYILYESGWRIYNFLYILLWIKSLLESLVSVDLSLTFIQFFQLEGSRVQEKKWIVSERVKTNKREDDEKISRRREKGIGRSRNTGSMIVGAKNCLHEDINTKSGKGFTHIVILSFLSLFQIILVTL